MKEPLYGLKGQSHHSEKASQKKIKVGINGLGRIGRQVFRLAFEKFDIRGINGLMPGNQMAHLLKHDSVHGTWNLPFEAHEKYLFAGQKNIPFSQQKDPAAIPWKDWGVDFVFECTGAFKAPEDFEKHLKAGAKNVLVSSPTPGAQFTVVYGINHHQYHPLSHKIISNASCTTNCLAPLAWVLNNTLGIKKGLMTTVHSYTNDQNLLDASHKDLRRARSAVLSMIPTTTGAAKAVGKILPELEGKIDGFAIRVPTSNVSLVDFTFESEKKTSVEEVNQILKQASQDSLKGILGFEEAPLVSSDYNGCLNSSTVDALSTMVIGQNMVKVMSWYDNEMGFSRRMIDMVEYMAQHLENPSLS